MRLWGFVLVSWQQGYGRVLQGQTCKQTYHICIVVPCVATFVFTLQDPKFRNGYPQKGIRKKQ